MYPGFIFDVNAIDEDRNRANGRAAASYIFPPRFSSWARAFCAAPYACLMAARPSRTVAEVDADRLVRAETGSSCSRRGDRVDDQFVRRDKYTSQYMTKVSLPLLMFSLLRTYQVGKSDD
jgi:hypothetical protein